ncbi:MAG: hypothetical protein ACJAT2_001772 [Bacteriovoracaceae bacterium]|jgi:hypothetical protein
MALVWPDSRLHSWTKKQTCLLDKMAPLIVGVAYEYCNRIQEKRAKNTLEVIEINKKLWK